MRLISLLVILLTAFLSSLGQTLVDGTVHDAAGMPVAGAAVHLQRENAGEMQSSASGADGAFHFNAVEAGPYTLKVGAANFYPAEHRFVLRARQPLSLTIDLQKKETVQQQVEVRSTYQTIDPEKTGSSYTFTHSDLEDLPAPISDNTNDLVNNLMPGASDSHDNFLAVRGTEFSLHEFINGVSFLDNTQPQFSSRRQPADFRDRRPHDWRLPGRIWQPLRWRARHHHPLGREHGRSRGREFSRSYARQLRSQCRLRRTDWEPGLLLFRRRIHFRALSRSARTQGALRLRQRLARDRAVRLPRRNQ